MANVRRYATYTAKYPTAWEDSEMRRQLLSEDIENIQNAHEFPQQAIPSHGKFAAKYDYQIILDDDRYELLSLEDRLMQARASFGLPVHGRNDVAKAMKYYLYNRYKTPDTNLAHNKTFTHVVFTRPDLNLLAYNGGALPQVKNHSETAMLWRRNPDLFKLLTDRRRCMDDNNFNMLLSNQVTSFDMQDETLSTSEAGKSWDDYEVAYGGEYSGRGPGEFSCNFTETNDYSVINLFKLWITYIYMVKRGAWRPSYDLHGDGTTISHEQAMSHVYTKTLDYGASAYVFKVGPDGSDVLYWTKYFGVFPLNTGAGALSWDLNNAPGEAPKLNIRFRYSAKRDLSPISLISFNDNANIQTDTDALFQEDFNFNYGHVDRPYVGCPFIEMRFEDPKPLRAFGANIGPDAANSSIRLRFKPNADWKLTDEVVYRNIMTKQPAPNADDMKGGTAQ